MNGADRESEVSGLQSGYACTSFPETAHSAFISLLSAKLKMPSFPFFPMIFISWEQELCHDNLSIQKDYLSKRFHWRFVFRKKKATLQAREKKT